MPDAEKQLDQEAVERLARLECSADTHHIRGNTGTLCICQGIRLAFPELSRECPYEHPLPSPNGETRPICRGPDDATKGCNGTGRIPVSLAEAVLVLLEHKDFGELFHGEGGFEVVWGSYVGEGDFTIITALESAIMEARK